MLIKKNKREEYKSFKAEASGDKIIEDCIYIAEEVGRLLENDDKFDIPITSKSIKETFNITSKSIEISENTDKCSKSMIEYSEAILENFWEFGILITMFKEDDRENESFNNCEDKFKTNCKETLDNSFAKETNNECR